MCWLFSLARITLLIRYRHVSLFSSLNYCESSKQFLLKFVISHTKLMSRINFFFFFRYLISSNSSSSSNSNYSSPSLNIMNKALISQLNKYGCLYVLRYIYIFATISGFLMRCYIINFALISKSEQHNVNSYSSYQFHIACWLNFRGCL
jgi:hypothetical protein